MDFAYTYGPATSLYLNATNRCTNRCDFCVRNHTDSLGSGVLHGGEEPELEELWQAFVAADGQTAVNEVIWCGFGEPTFRLDLILALAPRWRERGIKIRLNTNGHGSLIHGRDILPDLAGAIDELSISLNAPNLAAYLALCRPDPETVPGRPHPEEFWEAMLAFLTGAAGQFARVQASVVAHTLTDEEIKAAERLARDGGADAFRAR